MIVIRGRTHIDPAVFAVFRPRRAVYKRRHLFPTLSPTPPPLTQIHPSRPPPDHPRQPLCPSPPSRISPSSTNSYVLYLVCLRLSAASPARRFAQIAKDTYTVFDFWASWCGPCKVISPIFEKLATQFPNVEFYKVNVDEAEEISQEVGVRAVRSSIPHFWRCCTDLASSLCRCPPSLCSRTDRR